MTRATALEDGFRLELTLDSGRLYALAGLPAPRVGQTVRVRLDGGVRFPTAAAAAAGSGGAEDGGRGRT